MCLFLEVQHDMAMIACVVVHACFLEQTSHTAKQSIILAWHSSACVSMLSCSTSIILHQQTKQAFHQTRLAFLCQLCRTNQIDPSVLGTVQEAVC